MADLASYGNADRDLEQVFLFLSLSNFLWSVLISWFCLAVLFEFFVFLFVSIIYGNWSFVWFSLRNEFLNPFFGEGGLRNRCSGREVTKGKIDRYNCLCYDGLIQDLLLYENGYLLMPCSINKFH